MQLRLRITEFLRLQYVRHLLLNVLKVDIRQINEHLDRMNRSYISKPACEIEQASNAELLGQLAAALPFALEPSQRAAWDYQIQHLRSLAKGLPEAHFFMEFLIPRMGRRADLILVNNGIVFVIEYKLGARHFDKAGLDQVYGYGLDLKHFHETSHTIPIIPVLIATHAPHAEIGELVWDQDGLARPICSNDAGLLDLISRLSAPPRTQISPIQWADGRYRPTPTIIEAAQALYGGHSVDEISRSEAGAENLSRTADYIAQAIEQAKATKKKIICFVTGVPGSGKTLAGLNLATVRQRANADENAVFLSGNGPLVDVLREALALDAIASASGKNQRTTKVVEERRAAAFIQNIHHFRDEALTSTLPPSEKVVVFDEAQRAWDAEQASKFMQTKRGQIDFAISEPEFLLSVMDRHLDWCSIVCLIGEGQEINTGEAGVDEWLRALERSFPHWQVHVPPTLLSRIEAPVAIAAKELHLATSIRSFRAEKLSDFVANLIAGDVIAARKIRSELTEYPIAVCRDIDVARKWLRDSRRPTERAGLLASSNAVRLKPHGVFVKAKIEPAKWFLASDDDIRSSNALEDAGTEFDVQGLELDWAGVCWDGNYRRYNGAWEAWHFKGSVWQRVKDERRRFYIGNAYRVLMTRARQGLIVFVPHGSADDQTRQSAIYDETYEYLIDCGLDALPAT